MTLFGEKTFYASSERHSLRTSTYIAFEEDPRPGFCDLPVLVGSVPTTHLDTFGDKFKSSLIKIADDGIDMNRMRMVIDRDQRQVTSFFSRKKIKLKAALHISFASNLSGQKATLSLVMSLRTLSSAPMMPQILRAL